MKRNSDSIQKNVSHYFTKRRILEVVGSPRKNGNSDVLLHHILSGAKQENVFTERVHLRKTEKSLRPIPAYQLPCLEFNF